MRDEMYGKKYICDIIRNNAGAYSWCLKDRRKNTIAESPARYKTSKGCYRAFRRISTLSVLFRYGLSAIMYKVEFDARDRRIFTIKAIRNINCGMSLYDAVHLVRDNVAPVTFVDNTGNALFTIERAKEIRDKLVEAGATVEIVSG